MAKQTRNESGWQKEKRKGDEMNIYRTRPNPKRRKSGMEWNKMKQQSDFK